MRLNGTLRKLKQKTPAVGSWLSLGSPLIAEYMSLQGWDWLVVDTEHTPVSIETVLSCFQAMTASPVTPMARVRENNPSLIKQALDTGALGVVVPMVMDEHEAEAAAAACRYAPQGKRSIAAGVRATVYGADYVEKANEEIAVIVQIEHAHAVQRASKILKAPGVTAGFIGPNDLSWSMGVRPGDPLVDEAIAEALAKANEADMPMGILTQNAEDARRRIEQGFLMVGVGSDAAFIRSAGAQTFQEASGVIPQPTNPPPEARVRQPQDPASDRSQERPERSDNPPSRSSLLRKPPPSS